MDLTELIQQRRDNLARLIETQEFADKKELKARVSELDEIKKIVSRVEAKVKPANGDIVIDILDEKEKYYTKLLKEDVKNQDHIACIICESKLDFINEMQKELVSRLSV